MFISYIGHAFVTQLGQATCMSPISNEKKKGGAKLDCAPADVGLNLYDKGQQTLWSPIAILMSKLDTLHIPLLFQHTTPVTSPSLLLCLYNE